MIKRLVPEDRSFLFSGLVMFSRYLFFILVSFFMFFCSGCVNDRPGEMVIGSGDALPLALSGVWATADSDMQGIYLNDGLVLYLLVDGDGAVALSRPTRINRINARFDVSSLVLIITGQADEDYFGNGEFVYDRRLGTLTVKDCYGIETGTVFYRRIEAFTVDDLVNVL